MILSDIEITQVMKDCWSNTIPLGATDLEKYASLSKSLAFEVAQAQIDKYQKHLADLTPKGVREEIFTFLETIHCFQDDDGIPWGIPDETIEYIINHVCILITTQVEQAVKAERERIRKNR